MYEIKSGEMDQELWKYNIFSEIKRQIVSYVLGSIRANQD